MPEECQPGLCPFDRDDIRELRGLIDGVKTALTEFSSEMARTQEHLRFTDVQIRALEKAMTAGNGSGPIPQRLAMVERRLDEAHAERQERRKAAASEQADMHRAARQGKWALAITVTGWILGIVTLAATRAWGVSMMNSMFRYHGFTTIGMLSSLVFSTVVGVGVAIALAATGEIVVPPIRLDWTTIVVALIGATPTTLIAWAGLRSVRRGHAEVRKEQAEMHDQMNSRLDELKRELRERYFAEGEDAGRAKERADEAQRKQGAAEATAAIAVQGPVQPKKPKKKER